MDLRIYMKSGNNYYMDMSEYAHKELYDLLIDSICHKDTLTLYANGKTYFLLCEDIEYFELDMPTDEDIVKNKIGF